MNENEYTFLLAEKNCLREMIAEAPPEAVISIQSIKARMAQVEGQLANAKLIAAAPELLESLKGLIQVVMGNASQAEVAKAISLLGRIEGDSSPSKAIKCDRCGKDVDFRFQGGNCGTCGDDLCAECAIRWHEAHDDCCDRCYQAQRLGRKTIIDNSNDVWYDQ